MSTYEDYNLTSRVYDDKRTAVGSDVMTAMVQLYTGKQLKDLHVLDAGCGTENFAEALIKCGVGHVTMLDASTGMLNKAKDKLSGYIASGVIGDVAEAEIPPIPFPDRSFDAVMFNTVLNHLDRGDPTFQKCVETLKESRRVLWTNGLILISTILASTLAHNMWFSQLNKKMTERFIKILVPSLEQYEQMFHSAGIKCIQKMNILGSDMFKSYFYYDGPVEET